MSHEASNGESPKDDAGVAVPGNSVGFSLSQLGLETARQFGEVVGILGLEPRQFAVLHAVHRDVGLAQQAIGDFLGIPASTMVAIVDRLENEGLLERRPHFSDRRTRTLHLTSGGESLLARALAEAMMQEERICLGLAPHERTELLTLLHRISLNLGVASSAIPDRGSGDRPQRI